MDCQLVPFVVLLLGCYFLDMVHGKWWQNQVIYEIYPQSFYDSNGDGFGDLTGIKLKVDYLRELGVGAVWINPFFQSPFKDNGYDISDFRAINPKFGTMREFQEMLSTLTGNGIEVILDFVPNHTSDQHYWFKNSVKKIHPFTDYYVWRDPKSWDDGDPVPPNNWASVFDHGSEGSAWTWNEERQQFYYHSFLPEQPDLNLRNPRVLQSLKSILLFWLNKGVKGFRLDAVPHLVEDEQFRDEERYSHAYTQNLPETYEVIQDLRAFLDSYGNMMKTDIFMTVEAYSNMNKTMAYYGTENRPGAHFPFNFLLLTNLRKYTDANSLNRTISKYLNRLTETQHPNWVTGNHDWSRLMSRMGDSQWTALSVIMLAMLLPGTAIIYNGDEINMSSFFGIDRDECPPEVAYDYRTPFRTPFQWSPDRNAGFTKAAKPWIPINPEYVNVNVESESRRTRDAFLEKVKDLIQLRKRLAFVKGTTKTFVRAWNVFGFIREYGKSYYVVEINLNDNVSMETKLSAGIPGIQGATLIDMPFSSVELDDTCTQNRAECARKMMRSSTIMPPRSVFVWHFEKN